MTAFIEYMALWLGICLIFDTLWYLVHGSWPYGGRRKK